MRSFTSYLHPATSLVPTPWATYECPEKIQKNRTHHRCVRSERHGVGRRTQLEAASASPFIVKARGEDPVNVTSTIKLIGCEFTIDQINQKGGISQENP